jgi:hypothetical protein
LRLRQLKLAGYPFRANDLTLEEWADLGNLEDVMAGKEKTQEIGRMAQMLGIKLMGG